MKKQGGGVTPHEGVKAYVDLVVTSFEELEREFPQTADLFASFAKYRQGSSNFGYVELEKDTRLRDSLCQTEDGRKIFDELRDNAPLVTVSTSTLGDPRNTGSVRQFRIQEIEKDPLAALNSIASHATGKTGGLPDDFVSGIERLNRILELKPGAFGLSINVTRIIDDWIDKKRDRTNATRRNRAAGDITHKKSPQK